MPTINVTGSSPSGNNVPYTAATRSLADYMNAAYDKRRSNTRAEASYANADVNRQNRLQQREAQSRTMLSAEAAQTQLYNRRLEQQAADSKLRILNGFNARLQKRFTAEDRMYELADRMDFARDRRIEKKYYDDKQRLLTRANRGLAKVIADYDHEQKFGGYAEAHRENKRRDGLAARSSYLAMRYDADQDNRAFDAANAPGWSPSWHRSRIFGQLAAYGVNRLGGGGKFSSAVAAYSDGGLEGLAGAVPGLGVPLLAATGLAQLASTAWHLPNVIAGHMGGLMSQAQPYIGFMQGTAGLGRMGGYDSSLLRRDLYNGNSTPGWMAMAGLGPQDVMSIYGAYGARGDAGSDIQGIARAAARASMSSYLGGMDPSVYAAGYGQYQTLTGNGYIKPAGLGAISVGPNGPDNGIESDGNSYFRRMQTVMQAATTYGLDHSKVWGTVTSLLEANALSGAVGNNIGATSDFWNKMASGGLASMRDGSGVLAAAQGITATVNSGGYGGNSLQTMVVANHFSHSGGMPKSMAALQKQLGFNYSQLSPSERRAADNALIAAKSGNSLEFASAIAPFLSNSTGQGLEVQWARQYASMYGLDQFNTDTIAANLSGAGYSGILAAATSTGDLPPPAGLNGTVPDSIVAAVTKATDAANRSSARLPRVSPSEMLAVAGAESGFGKNIADPTGLNVGQFQITRDTFRSLQKQGTIPANWTYGDMSDPNKAAYAATALYQQDLKQAGGDPKLAYRFYHYGSGYKPGMETAKTLIGDRNFDRYLDNFTNNNADANLLMSRNAQTQLQAGQQSFNEANAIYSGPLGDVIQNFSGDVTNFGSAVASFSKAVQNWMAGGSSGSTRPYIPARSMRPHPNQP